jgi:hypothetical protein
MFRFFSRFLVGLSLTVFVANCNTKLASPRVLHQAVKKESPKIVLITIDGVRWQEVLNGTDPLLHEGRSISAEEMLPNIHRYFVERGSAFGKESPVVVSGTNHISLPGYLEMMRGIPTIDCVTNLCEPQLQTTLLDYFSKVAVFSSWDTVRKASTSNPDRIVINTGRDYRSAAYEDLHLKDDHSFDCYVGHFDYRPDEFTMVSVLDYISHEKPQFLWVSLGDTDEHAHAGNYRGYISALKRADYYIGDIIQSYDDNTIFIITTDHGRSQNWRNHGYDSESSRVWLMIHGSGIPHSGHSRLDRTVSLSDILPTVLKLTHGITTKKSFI